MVMGALPNTVFAGDTNSMKLSVAYFCRPRVFFICLTCLCFYFDYNMDTNERKTLECGESKL